MITSRSSSAVTTQHIHTFTIPNVLSSTLKTVPQSFINNKFALCEYSQAVMSVATLALTHIHTRFKDRGKFS